MAWLRLYDDILDDPKIQMLSDRAFRALINLWCLAKRNGGKLPGDIKSLSFSLRWPEGKVRETLQALISARLIDKTETGYEPHDWDQHQFTSDGHDKTSAERMRRYRARNPVRTPAATLRPSDASRDGSVTVLEPDTETEQISITRAKPARSKTLLNGHEKDFNQFWDVYPKRVDKGDAIKAYAKALERADVATILAGAKTYAQNRKDEDPTFTKGPAHWLRADCWLDDLGPQAVPADPVKAAADLDRRDRLLKRGKYASEDSP